MGKRISYVAMLSNKPLVSFFPVEGHSEGVVVPALQGDTSERGFLDDERIVSLETRREYVKELLSDGCWHKTGEINSKEIGGTEGTRRLRELREERYGGLVIEKRKEQNGDEFEYRIIFPLFSDSIKIK